MVDMSLGECPLCGSCRHIPFARELLTCSNCSLVLSPRIWQVNANQEAEAEWFEEGYQKNASPWIEIFENWNNKKTLSNLQHWCPPACNLLEIGIGSGSLLNAARALGYNVLGCDLSKTICSRADTKYGLHIHNGPVNTIPGCERFQVVVMNHVLEHVESPIAFLQSTLNLLEPGGTIYVAVPNVRCWEAHLQGWTSYQPYHLAYYSPHTLRQAITTCGFTVDALSTNDSFSGWYLTLLRTCLVVLGLDGRLASGAGALHAPARSRGMRLAEHIYRLAMVGVGAGMWPIRFLQGKLGYGDQIIVIAHKSKSNE